MEGEAAGDHSTLAQEYALAELRFRSLVAEVRLPFPEVRLYERYLIKVERTRATLKRLLTVLHALMLHKERTVALLHAIFQREQVLAAVHTLAADFREKRVGTLEAQTKYLQLLFALQQLTLAVVDAIASWRDGLTRPFPFMWQGGSYFAKISADCAALDDPATCPLATVVPTQLTRFPLASNLPALQMFRTAGLPPIEGPQPAPGTAPAVLSVTYPLRVKVPKGGTVPPVPSKVAAKLAAAEAAVLGEAAAQQALAADLAALADAGRVLPLLDCRRAIPTAAQGVPCHNAAWLAQFRQAAAAFATAATQPPPASPTKAPQVAAPAAAGDDV